MSCHIRSCIRLLPDRNRKISEALNSYLAVPYEDIERYAVPRLIHIYLEKLNGNLPE